MTGDEEPKDVDPELKRQILDFLNRLEHEEGLMARYWVRQQKEERVRRSEERKKKKE